MVIWLVDLVVNFNDFFWLVIIKLGCLIGRFILLDLTVSSTDQ